MHKRITDKQGFHQGLKIFSFAYKRKKIHFQKGGLLTALIASKENTSGTKKF